LEGVYAQILGKSDPEIQADSKLAELIQSNLANVESAFTSFNGTIKSIKLAIDSMVISFLVDTNTTNII
jgi:hypothetical protein